MKNLFHFFGGSFIVASIGLVIAFLIGGPQGLFIAAILAVLEISLSFDNAIINAKVLTGLSLIWRKRFLTWGMLIAVFGMRLIFPVAIVSIVAMLSPLQALILAISRPEQYAITLKAAQHIISGFGGGFLIMVFFNFFFDQEKKIHWIHIIEKHLVTVARLESVEIFFALVITYVTSVYLPAEQKYGFLVAGIFGICTFLLVKGIEHVLKSRERSVTTAAQAGLATFLYLEVLDASFSFDGVIGAFALSKNIFIIMIGLSIGAFFVRSLTILFVKKDTLAEFLYLEHGAYWAIGALAIVMYIGSIREVPEIITGLIGIVLIILSYISSVRQNK